MRIRVGEVVSIQVVCGSLVEVEYKEKIEKIREHEREEESVK